MASLYKTKKSLISIIMPVKNAGKYLSECLDSILTQSIDNWELLAVNDNSSDNSFDMLNEFAKQDNRIHVFQNTGSGIIDALQLGYAKSKGNFITRMDSDDKMDKEKLFHLQNALIENGNGYVATGFVKYFSENALGNGYKKYETWLNTLTEGATNFNEIYKECVIPSPCWMVNRIDFEKCGAFHSNVYPEDYDLCFRFYENILNVCGVNKILHYWRDYTERTSRNDDNYADNRFLDVKLHYFLKLDHKKEKELALYGAGKKGKLLAKKLIVNNISFSWCTNNSKKNRKRHLW